MSEGRHARPMDRRICSARRVFVSLVVVGVVGGVAGHGALSAFSSTTGNSANSFNSGTVSLSDDDGGSTMLTLSNAKPGDSVTGCIKVSYGGSLSANVHLYATVTGSLAQYVNVTVTRGTGGSFGSCGAFGADTTNYTGAGAGVIYSGTLSAYPTSYASGVVDPTNCGTAPCSTQTWTNGNNHMHEITVSLANNSSAQGLSSTATFTWEAQNT